MKTKFKLAPIIDYLNEVKESPLNNELKVSNFKFLLNKFVVGYELEFLYNKNIPLNHNKLEDAAKKALPNDLHTFITKQQYENLKPILITEFIDKISMPSFKTLSEMMKHHKTFYSSIIQTAAKEFNVESTADLTADLLDDIVSTLSEQEFNTFKFHYLNINFYLVNSSLILKYKNVYNILKEYNLLEQLIVSDSINYHNIIMSDLHDLCGHITTDIRVVDDTSVYDIDTRYTQAEIITPPLPLQQSLDLLDIITKYISTHGITNRTCGLHVNISFLDKNRFYKVDWLKLTLFLNDPVLLNAFDRQGNAYTASIYNLLLDWLPKNIKNVFKDIANNKPTVDDPDMFRTILNMESSDKHYTFRIRQSLKYIEFRIMGNTDYNSQVNKIKNVMHRIMNAMLIASNVSLNKKDYIKKLLTYAKLKTKIAGELKPYVEPNKTYTRITDIPKEARDIIDKYTSNSINPIEFIKYIGD